MMARARRAVMAHARRAMMAHARRATNPMMCSNNPMMCSANRWNPQSRWRYAEGEFYPRIVHGERRVFSRAMEDPPHDVVVIYITVRKVRSGRLNKVGVRERQQLALVHNKGREGGGWRVQHDVGPRPWFPRNRNQGRGPTSCLIVVKLTFSGGCVNRSEILSPQGHWWAQTGGVEGHDDSRRRRAAQAAPGFIHLVDPGLVRSLCGGAPLVSAICIPENGKGDQRPAAADLLGGR